MGSDTDKQTANLGLRFGISPSIREGSVPELETGMSYDASQGGKPENG